MPRGSLTAALVLVLAAPALAAPQDAPPPKGKALAAMVRDYLLADEAAREAMRRDCDSRYAPLTAGRRLAKLRKAVLKAAAKIGPKFERKGRNFRWPDEERGKYISRGGNKTLFIGLHGGGEGAGEAESAAGSMGGGGWSWIFPEVLEKTARGWTTSGTEEFVMELIDAAKRTGKVDPNRIYITGHSMGGYGTWTLGAHHADVFAGAAAYAGAASPIFAGSDDQEVIGIVPGVLPNFFNLPLFFYQSLDDVQVRPRANIYANKELTEVWKKQHPDGFDFRYVQVDGRGHAAPKEGYLPSQRWIASHERVARPKKFLWQTALGWKHHFYWIYWREPEIGALVQVEAPGGNVVKITTLEATDDLKGISVLLGEPLVNLDEEIVVQVDGVEKFRGKVSRTFSTILMTAPRHDPDLLFDARIDL